MVPQRLHVFIRLGTVAVECATLCGVLVVGYDEVQLVHRVVEPQLEHVVRLGGHGPVVVADDALVVVDKFLPAQLDKQSLLGLEAQPGLVQVEVAFARLPPQPGVLNGHFGIDELVTIGGGEPETRLHERPHVVHVVFDGHTSISPFAAGEQLGIEGELIALGRLLFLCGHLCWFLGGHLCRSQHCHQCQGKCCQRFHKISNKL